MSNELVALMVVAFLVGSGVILFILVAVDDNARRRGGKMRRALTMGLLVAAATAFLWIFWLAAPSPY